MDIYRAFCYHLFSRESIRRPAYISTAKPVIHSHTPAGEWVAEADLQPSQIQDLADCMGDLLGAAAGSEIKFHLRVELDKNASQQVKQSVNTSLEQISPGFSFDKGR